MDNRVTVIATRKDDGSLSFEWEGPEDGFLAVSDELLELEPDVMGLLPWEMVEVQWTGFYLHRVKWFRRKEYANG